MKNLSRLLSSLLTSVALLLLLSHCDRSEISSSQSIKMPYVVSAEEALSVAQQFDSKAQPNNSRAKANATYEVINQKTIFNEVNNKPIFHVMNRTKGFIIVSADLRTMPVIAYSDEGQFDTDESRMPTGVKMWFETAKTKIKDVERQKIDSDSIVIKEWKKYLTGTLNLPHSGAKTDNTNCLEWYQYGQYQCKTVFYTTGPLLNTQWGQDLLSSTALRSANCGSCQRQLAGCGPVAMAQIYEYYRPDSALPRLSNGSCTAASSGESALGQLMSRCGGAALSRYEYLGTCNTYTWPSDCGAGLQSMGFTNRGTTNAGYNYGLIKSEIAGRHPLIFWGTTCDTCFNDYHIWVCDGVDEHNYSEFDCDTKQCSTFGYSYLHMNWGWGDTGWNGWYSIGQYNPGGQDYNTNLHIISGIRS